MKIREKQLAFHITTCCTLNCRLCVTMVPLFKESGKSRHTPVASVKKEIDAVFELYDFIDDITLSGGEPLLHPDLNEIIEYSLFNYEHQFNHLRIFTNGTLIPSESLFELLKNNKQKLQLVIDDYGSDNSIKTQEINMLMQSKNITPRINKYCGDEQHCGGWVDYGSPSKYRGYSDEEIDNLYKNCHVAQYKCIGVYEGTLVNCCWAIFGRALGYMGNKNETIPHSEDGMINLFDPVLSLTEKRKKAAAFGTIPLKECQYCNGFDPIHSPRFPAGEQII